MGFMDWVHGTLDVAGMVPVIGEVADGLNAGLYAVQGDYVNAGISLAGMLPIGGQAVTGTRLGAKVLKEGAEQLGRRGGREVIEEGVEQGARELAEREAKEKAAREAAERNVGSKVSESPPTKKPRQPRKYEKKVVNEDGSVTYTFKSKDGSLVDVTYRDGYPDFNPHKYNGSLGKSEVQIEMTGNNTVDFRRANEAAGFGNGSRSHPSGYTWHHHQDGRTMQLIDSNAHGAAPHTGGASGARGG